MKKQTAIVALFATVVIASSSSASAQAYEELIGEWTTREGPQHGARLEIRPNNDTMDSIFGQGRIAESTEWGANYKIVYRGNIKCYFYLSISGSGGNRNLNVEVMSPGTASHYQCIRGYFVRRTDSGRAY